MQLLNKHEANLKSIIIFPLQFFRWIENVHFYKYDITNSIPCVLYLRRRTTTTITMTAKNIPPAVAPPMIRGIIFCSSRIEILSLFERHLTQKYITHLHASSDARLYAGKKMPKNVKFDSKIILKIVLKDLKQNN